MVVAAGLLSARVGTGLAVGLFVAATVICWAPFIAFRASATDLRRFWWLGPCTALGAGVATLLVVPGVASVTAAGFAVVCAATALVRLRPGRDTPVQPPGRRSAPRDDTRSGLRTVVVVLALACQLLAVILAQG